MPQDNEENTPVCTDKVILPAVNISDDTVLVAVKCNLDGGKKH